MKKESSITIRYDKIINIDIGSHREALESTENMTKIKVLKSATRRTWFGNFPDDTEIFTFLKTFRYLLKNEH